MTRSRSRGMNLLRGEVWWVDLNPTKGSEINKKRPCVILSADILNQRRRTVVVVPLSTAPTVRPPVTVAVSSGGRPAVAVIGPDSCDREGTIWQQDWNIECVRDGSHRRESARDPRDVLSSSLTAATPPRSRPARLDRAAVRSRWSPADGSSETPSEFVAERPSPFHAQCGCAAAPP